jgi:hypothetical protein
MSKLGTVTTLRARLARLGRQAEAMGQKPARTVRLGFLLFPFDLNFLETVISSKLHIKWIKTQKNVNKFLWNPHG